MVSDINQEIDIVLTWVDDSDEVWRRERNEYLQKENVTIDTGDLNSRYRDWDNIQYIFRGIEKYMPWVRKVHFVTCGHLPKWLNVKNSKLNIVRHEDFIPSEYLPTFNSNAIELNICNIPGLAENFIVFNDDMFVINKTVSEDFFANGKPCDMAAVSPVFIQNGEMPNIEVNNLKVINSYFSPADIKKNRSKWIRPLVYGQYAFRTAMLMNFSTVIGIFQPHIPCSYKKSVWQLVWDKEREYLKRVCCNKFRSALDCNIWLFREWQLLSGDFEPRSYKFGQLLFSDNTDGIRNAIKSQGCKLICINDSAADSDFEKQKELVNAELEKLFPEKSSFEL